MDDCLAQVAIDFEVETGLGNRICEMVGKMPTEMFLHFFKSFSDGAKQTSTSKPKELMSTKIEAILRFRKAIKVAV
jgi:imidazoleglycerol-phosphate dehydratase/histidinol-phosphatase